jgi:[glutamine synthetase] adenylyltransferase / [glutamine synthetase]-adenylyl-L-tyrosine phosphorylase
VTQRPPSTLAGRLARMGFTDIVSSERLLASPSLGGFGPGHGFGPGLGLARDEAFLAAVASTADPDLALAGFAALTEALADGPGTAAALHEAVAEDGGLRDRLLGVLGASVALGEHLARHPEHWRVLAGDAAAGTRPTAAALRRELLGSVGADPAASEPVAAGARPEDRLRVGYRRLLLSVAARDVTGVVGVEDVGAELADLAAATLDAALAVARLDLDAGSEPCRIGVIAMGKCGGRELNYVSDVDVIFVAEPVQGGDEAAALVTANRLAAALMRVCSAQTGEGTIWPVDANLRPEGRSGALVRTLASHRAYYERWAQTWEFQALLKARPVAGDLTLGQEYVDMLGPLVWRAADRDGFVEDARAMRRRVETSLPAKDADRELKLGPGGLRDVEFSVQLLQLVHGRSDVFIRSPTTLLALEQLSTHGYVGRTDAADLDHAYRFLRTMEHRIQLFRLRRSHVVPTEPAELRRIARSMGFRGDPENELVQAWRRHSQQVRRLHEKLFYRPLLNAVARLEPGEARLTPEAASARLEALGYADPTGALRHIEALTSGVSRRAAIQRTLLPVMLGWFAEWPDPDAGLLGFRQVSDALGATHWYLGLLRDGGATAERLARLLASSRYATDLLLRQPEAVAMLTDDAELVPRSRNALVAEALAAARRNDGPEQAVAAVRAIRRRALFRTAAADLLDRLDLESIGPALADVTAASLEGALDVAIRAVEHSAGTPFPTRMSVVAMGRFGGREVGYGSDADVMFVHDPLPGVNEQEAGEAAHAVANEMRRLLDLPGPDPRLLVDADLRPEGRQGPLVRSLASYAAYYERWSAVWESQALLRAQPAAGNPELGSQFVELIDPVRYPVDGLTVAQVREVRRIKARVEAERLPRGADPGLHTKLGRGGLADVEWTVQLLQLRFGAQVEGLRTTGTLDALAAAAAAGLIDPGDAAVLADAWRLATTVRNAVVLARGRPSDTFPSDVRDLAGVSRLVGYAPGQAGQMVEDYRRATRRARVVVERVFFE